MATGKHRERVVTPGSYQDIQAYLHKFYRMQEDAATIIQKKWRRILAKRRTRR